MTIPPPGSKEFYRDHPVGSPPPISFRPIREGRNPMPEILAIVGLSMLAWGMVVLAVMLIWASTPASAHDAPLGWSYDTFCCNGNGQHGDCAPVPASSIKAVDGGYEITLRPGDHPMITRPHIFFKAWPESRLSQDGNFHVCLWPSQDSLRCLYVPPVGM